MKLKIGAKLGLSFAVILILMLFSGVLSYFKLSVIRENADIITTMRVPTLDNDRRLQTDLQYSASKSRQIILAGTDPARRAKGQESYNKVWVSIEEDVSRLSELAPRWSLQESRDRLNEIKNGLPKLKQAQQEAMDLAASGAHDAVVQGEQLRRPRHAHQR